MRAISLVSAQDREIFEYARRDGDIIMTKDSDFVELLHRFGSPPQIVWFTCGNVSNRRLRSLLTSTFNDTLRLLADGETLVEIGDA